MTHLLLPGFLYGEDSFEVSAHLEPLIRRIANGRPALDMLLPTAVPESGQSSVPVVMTPHGFTFGFHISSLMPPLYDALVNEALETGTEEGHAQLMTRLTDLYAEVLTTPWGVLCSLVNDAQMWLFEDSPLEDNLHHKRFLLLLKAAKRESSWLHSMNGRYDYGGEKPGHLWQAPTVITWLAARHNLPIPTSQATWESTVDQLLQVARR
ncbi:hypothetical protein [Deinococcus aquatilis]|uniref:hypothetical protein n=1 Tax=Deinococcus aquatilis TaxID=519440 RepID=UPI0012F8C5EC|nr:hypothetical protein [Deinococcus aquatilis]